MGTLVIGWLIVMARVLRHRIFVSHDSLISYAHVWYISMRLWHDHRLPMAMPALSHGAAFAFPYGFVPWAIAAVLRPGIGDRAVTLVLVVGTTALIAATFLAFPELRRQWWSAAALVNPAIVAGLLIGQLPFLWAAAGLLGAVACWRRGHRRWATVLLAAAQVTHVGVIGPIALAVVIVGWRRERDRRQLLTAYVVSLLAALPAAIIVVRSPVYSESSLPLKVWTFANTVGPRSLVVVLPLALVVVMRRWTAAWVAPAAFVAVIAMNAAMWGPLGMTTAWHGMEREPDTRMQAFLHSSDFRPGATYRILRVGDERVGLYQLLRAGGRSDAEFFPESVLRRSWPSEQTYAAMLRSRHVNEVMLWANYVRVARTNEGALLARLADRDPSGCRAFGMCVRLVDENPLYRVYEIETRPARSAAT